MGIMSKVMAWHVNTPSEIYLSGMEKTERHIFTNPNSHMMQIKVTLMLVMQAIRLEITFKNIPLMELVYIPSSETTMSPSRMESLHHKTQEFLSLIHSHYSLMVKEASRTLLEMTIKLSTQTILQSITVLTPLVIKIHLSNNSCNETRPE